MVVVLVFVICNCLAMVSNILELFEVEAVSVTMVSNFLVTLNSSVNLFVYCAFGERFRAEIKRLAKMLRKKIARCCYSNYDVKTQDQLFLNQHKRANFTKSKSVPNIALSVSSAPEKGQHCKSISAAPQTFT